MCSSFFLPVAWISSFSPVGILEKGRSDFVGDVVTSKKWKIMIEKLDRPTVYERFGTPKTFIKEKF